MKLKLGMKVRVTEDQEDYAIKDLVGILVKEYYDWGRGEVIGVKFNSNEFDDGHELDGALPRGSQNGLWVETDKLKPFNTVLENK